MKIGFSLAGLAVFCGVAVLCVDFSPIESEVTQGNHSSGGPRHSHEHTDACTDCGGGVILRRVATIDDRADWMSAEVGEDVALGFSIAGAEAGRVTMSESFKDGRLSTSIRLTNGHDLFIAKSGPNWEGRVIPESGEKGWRVLGEGNKITIEELEVGAMICSWRADDGGEVAGLPPIHDPFLIEESGIPEVGETLPLLLNSLPGANGVIYLDFDGETVTGTQWNSSYNGGAPIIAAPSGFSDAKMETVWKGVSEDYRPFNVNVTTDRAVFDSYPVNRRAMLVFTPSNEWYGSSGGVAYVNVFGSGSFDAPGWVFVDQLSNSANYASEAASHEAGHMLGLSHDGTSTKGYYEGHGSGATSWAAIMGVGYYSNVTQWSKGEYPDANNFQDDLAIVSNSYNGLGYRSDDHGGSSGSATPMIEVGSDQLNGSGVIERNTDSDYLSFQTSGGAVVINVNNSDYDPNLDIRLRLLNSSGGQVAESNLDGNLDASISVTVPAGDYFLEVQGTGSPSPTPGYGDYGSLGSYFISGTAPRETILAANIVSPSVEALSINEGAGLSLDGFVSGGSPNWELVSAPAGGSVAFSSPASSSTEAIFAGSGSYILRLNSDGGGEVVSDEVTVLVETAATLSSSALNLNLGPDRMVYSNSLTLWPAVSAGDSASISSYQWSVVSGSGQLNAFDIAQPELTFPTAGTTDLRLLVDFGTARLFQDVSLTASFSGLQLLTSGSTGKTFSPSNGDLGDSWRQISFDDSSWQTGLLGAGYEVLNGANSPIYAGLIGTGLDVESTMYKKTEGCYIRSSFNVQDASSMLSLTLSVCFDDGFVAYLNGVEVARSNAPSGSPVWNSLALTDRLDSAAISPVEFPIALSPGLLVDGTNVLAIHGMNSAVSVGEREFLLVPQIEGIVALTPYSITMGAVSDPELTLTTADADGDGMANLFEHGAGSSPTSVDDPFNVVGLLDEVTAALILPETPPDDVQYTLWHSMDLDGSWSPIASRTGTGPWTGLPVVDVLPLPDGKERTCFALQDGERGFLRLQMDLVAP